MKTAPLALAMWPSSSTCSTLPKKFGAGSTLRLCHRSTQRLILLVNCSIRCADGDEFDIQIANMFRKFDDIQDEHSRQSPRDRIAASHSGHQDRFGGGCTATVVQTALLIGIPVIR